MDDEDWGVPVNITGAVSGDGVLAWDNTGTESVVGAPMPMAFIAATWNCTVAPSEMPLSVMVVTLTRGVTTFHVVPPSRLSRTI